MNNMLKRLLDILASAAGLLLLSQYLLLIYLIRKAPGAPVFHPNPAGQRRQTFRKW